MSGALLPLKTYVNAVQPLWAAAGSGGGGGGGGGTTISTNTLFASTLTLEGSTQPLSIDLPAAANDGFEVRQGGGSNPIAILTIDALNGGQAEFGIRSISTISGNPVNRGRLEMQVVPGTDVAQLTYTLDTVGAGNASTIGSIQFKPGTAPNTSVLTLEGEDGQALSIGNGGVSYGTAGTRLNMFKAPIQSGGNIYVPAAGTTQLVSQFSTVVGHAYELWIPDVRVQNEPATAPAAGAWSQLIVDVGGGALETFDMASVSTIANDLQKSANYNFVATAAGHNLQAIGSIGNTVSTAFTISPAVYLRDLGAPVGFTTIG
jgi:hypothetical protein